jgi:hypothetical protein
MIAEGAVDSIAETVEFAMPEFFEYHDDDICEEAEDEHAEPPFQSWEW